MTTYGIINDQYIGDFSLGVLSIVWQTKVYSLQKLVCKNVYLNMENCGNVKKNYLDLLENILVVGQTFFLEVRVLNRQQTTKTSVKGQNNLKANELF